MSEEEIIDYLKESIEHSEYNFENFGEHNYLDMSTINAISKLLDLYNKQKEEIEELNKEFALNTEIHKRDKEIKELKDIIKCLHEPSENYISKDKIVKKREELEKEKEKYKGDKGLIYSQVGFIQSGINVLNKLLEEE